MQIFFSICYFRDLGNFIFFRGTNSLAEASYRCECQNHKQYKLEGERTTRAEGEAREANLWISAKKVRENSKLH